MTSLFVPYRNNAGIITQIDRDKTTEYFNIYYTLSLAKAYEKINSVPIPNKTSVYGLGYHPQYNQIIYFISFSDLKDSTPDTIVYFKLTGITGGVESSLAEAKVVESAPYTLQNQGHEQVEIKDIESFSIANAYGHTEGAPLMTSLHTKGRKVISGYYSASDACTILVQVSLDGQTYRDFHTITLTKAGDGFINYTTAWDYIRFKCEDTVDLIFELSAKN